MPEALELYRLFSTLEYLPSSPTLFNSGTRHEQLSSCFLLDSPDDHLEHIYQRYTDVALLSKFSGGIGLAYHRVRSRGSLIESTNGHSNGIVPWLKTLDASVAAVNQGGKRKGACCVYLEPWHADIEEFLELRDNTGDEAKRTHNLNLANWIPDLFMRRVEADGDWSLFDPKRVPDLPDLYGEAFERRYEEAERAGLAAKTVKARDLYARMMRTLAQTGNGWMTFKDKSNRACNQTALPGRTVHLSNLCTEILEVTSKQRDGGLQPRLDQPRAPHASPADGKRRVRLREARAHRAHRGAAARSRDRSQLLPDRHRRRRRTCAGARWASASWACRTSSSSCACRSTRPRRARCRRGSPRRSTSTRSRPRSSSRSRRGAHPAFDETRAARGELQFDAWGVDARRRRRAGRRCARASREHGLRNSLLVAIAPTATIASIAGCYECIEPQVSNLFKRETLSGDFLQMNRYLVDELKALGLWNDATRARLKLAEGSVQGDRRAARRRSARSTARSWEIPMRSLIDMAADRGAFIDQSQSLNLFIENPNIGQLSSMYFYAWKKGLKTTYYLRSRPATRIAKATVETPPAASDAGGDPHAHGWTPPPPAAARRGRRRLLAREPRELRGVPVSAVEPPRAPARSRACA